MNFVNARKLLMPMTFARRAKRRKRDFFMRQKRRDYVDRRCRRDPSLRSVARADDAGRIVSLGTRDGRGICLALRRGEREVSRETVRDVNCTPRLTMFARDDFVDRRKLIPLVTFAGGPDRIGGFGAGGRNASQQELGEMAEGGGFLARNAPLREQAKNLSEGAVHAGGGGEVAAGGIEFGKIECGADDVTSG